MPQPTAELDKLERVSLQISSLKLDANGNVPTRFMLMQTGDWNDSVKGDFKIKLENLKNIKANFDAGIGFPTEDASTGLAIDLMHNYAEEAAGWIKGLELQVDEQTGEGKLYANPVEWTALGLQKIQSGEFKCVSPSGYFGERNGKVSMWANPNNLKEKVQDVLDGAGLTNIPFLRGMAPIRADRKDGGLDDNDSAYGKVIYVVQDQHKKEQHMNLDSIRVKERAELSVPELDFLGENKEKLSAPELEKFQLKVEGKEEVAELSAEDKELLESIKSGDKKVVAKEELSAEQAKIADLEKTALDYKTEKAEQVVDKHIARGAIKQDAREFWTKQLLSVNGEARDALETQLSGLPDNELLKDENNKEKGTSEDTAAGSTAREQLDAMAKARVQEAAKEGKTLLYGDALKEVTRANKDLAKQDGKEQLGVK